VQHLGKATSIGIVAAFIAASALPMALAGAADVASPVRAESGATAKSATAAKPNVTTKRRPGGRVVTLRQAAPKNTLSGYSQHTQFARPNARSASDEVTIKTEVSVRKVVRTPIATKGRKSKPKAKRLKVKYTKKASVAVKDVTAARSVQLQSRIGAEPWVVRQNLTTSATGTVAFSYPIEPGITSWRIVAPAVGDVPAIASEIRRVSGITDTMFVINPASQPAPGVVYTADPRYNDKTKDWFLLGSYLDALEQLGGGTLVLQAGTYDLATALGVPSNTTIVMQNGATLRKTNNTDGKMDVQKSLLHFVAPSLMGSSKTVGGYNGSHDVVIRGEGEATLDLQDYKDGIGLLLGHNNNVRVEGLIFRNMFSGHFIELNATNNATITRNSFLDSKPSPSGDKEAINVDTPDASTKGFNAGWAIQDRTPTANAVIDGNYFRNLDRAVGTHKYSGVTEGDWLAGRFHANIQVANNVMTDMRSDPISVMNWRLSTITNNTIDGAECDKCRGVLVRGADDLTIRNNTFRNMPRPVQIMPWVNRNSGDTYKPIFNRLTDLNIADMAQNVIGVGVQESFIRINIAFGEFGKPLKLPVVGTE